MQMNDEKKNKEVLMNWRYMYEDDEMKNYVDKLNEKDYEIVANEHTSKLHKELILKNANFEKNIHLTRIHMGGNLIKNKPVLSKNNVSYFSTEKSILCIDLKKKKKKKIVTSFFIDKIFYFNDIKGKQEYLILKGFNNYFYIYSITKNKIKFVKTFYIKNLFYINSFGKNGELCFVTWEYIGKKMYMNFFLLRFIFKHKNDFYNFDDDHIDEFEKEKAKEKKKKKNISSTCPTHVMYTFSSDSEEEYEQNIYPIELMEENEKEKEEKKEEEERKKKQEEGVMFTVQLKIKPILKIKYMYFSMIDMNTSLSKLVIANNNLIILYDLVRNWYNVFYYSDYISCVKLSDENFLCIGFVRGYIYAIIFDEILHNFHHNYTNNKMVNEEDLTTMYRNFASSGFRINNPSRLMHFFRTKINQNSHVSIFGVDYIREQAQKEGRTNGYAANGCDSPEWRKEKIDNILSNIPYISLQLNEKNIIKQQKVNVIRYKWHSHSVYNISIEGKKIISSGEEAVLLIYNLESGHMDYISHLGCPCYYIYVNAKKNLIICNSLDNSLIFLNYNKRLIFYKYKGISMPLSLRHLFYNNISSSESVKNSLNIFLNQINDHYDYTYRTEYEIKKKETLIDSNYSEKENQSPFRYDKQSNDNVTLFYNDTSDHFPDEDSLSESENDDTTSMDEENVEDGIEIGSSVEEENSTGVTNTEGYNNDGKCTTLNDYQIKKMKNKNKILSFKCIQNELEKQIYMHMNVENNIYKKYQMTFYCDSNGGLLFCFLTTFANLQLYNVEKDKHVKVLCPLNMLYKGRTDKETVNDMELLVYAFNHSRNVLMTIERRNFVMEKFSPGGEDGNNFVHTIYTTRIWDLMQDLEYQRIFDLEDSRDSIVSGGGETVVCSTGGMASRSNLERYKEIVSHPFLSMFIVLESEGKITIWCFENSEEVFEEKICDDFDIDSFEINSFNHSYRLKELTLNMLYTENFYDRDVLNSEEEKMKKNNDAYLSKISKKYKIVTIIKNIHYNNHPILQGDISKDGKILCICHDKLITIWDFITMKTLAVINHPLYTTLNAYIFNMYKGVQIMEVDGIPYLCYFSFDTLFIYSMHQFHLVQEKKFTGLIEYVKFDKYSNAFLAIGITKREKTNTCGMRKSHLIQKNYLYEFNPKYLKKKKLFYASKDKPIVVVDFAPINSNKNVTLSKHHRSSVLVSLNSKFQICTFYFNNYPNFMQLR
ncbi:conserved Plasmodium protein, unknown function [Plasmodium ovale curtisi]|uniref:WD repeat-containing protein n=1 Tax=Plasmodium ovale curtisi TaxID=864141 RepID=A0A1A8WGM8_PLAOA|nr:conserved Plasmodium protein, unknown function [Plasmodium ovale curtisi]